MGGRASKGPHGVPFMRWGAHRASGGEALRAQATSSRFSMLPTRSADRFRSSGSNNQARAKVHAVADLELEECMIPPEEAVKLADGELSAATTEALCRLQRTLRAYRAVDFDDLIALPVAPSSMNIRMCGSDGRTKLRYLLVDGIPGYQPRRYRCSASSPGYAGCSSRWATTQAIRWRSAGSTSSCCRPTGPGLRRVHQAGAELSLDDGDTQRCQPSSAITKSSSRNARSLSTAWASVVVSAAQSKAKTKPNGWR